MGDAQYRHLCRKQTVKEKAGLSQSQKILLPDFDFRPQAECDTQHDNYKEQTKQQRAFLRK